MTSESLTELRITNFKRQLESQQQNLQIQLQQTDDSTKPVTLDQQSVGRVSRIDAIQQQQMASANKDHTIALLKQVDAALKRIKSDSYGLCLVCDEPIALPRLDAHPPAANCITCQSKQES